MKEQVLDLLENKYDAMPFDDIMHELKLDTVEEINELQDVLNELVSESQVYFTKKSKYILLDKMSNFKKGVIDIKDKGFGFLLSTVPGEKDIHIEKNYMNGALDGDTVLVEVLGDNPKRPEGKVLKVLERGKMNVVGEVQVIKSKKVFVTNDSKFKNITINIDYEELNKCVEGEIIAVALKEKNEKNDSWYAVLKSRMGHKDDPGMDIIELAAKYGVFEEFPEAAMEQAESLPTEVLDSERERRTDLTGKVIFTIDGKDTKDIDDAISVDKLDNGNYLLGVHIADVSHYVTEGSPLDEEALERATSNYPGDKVIPQLPHILSNGICSLNEGVDRLSITCEMEINKQGRVIDADVFPSIIRSRKKMNYSDCNAILDGIVAEGYEEFVDDLLLMKELHELIRKEREGRGATDFDTVEPKFVFNDEHHVIDVIARERGVYEKVIEDFMIVANESVARKFQYFDKYSNGLPSIYRVHAEPSVEKVQQFITYCSGAGYPIKGKYKEIPNPKVFQNLLKQIDAEGEEREIIMKMAIRTMAKAAYSKENIGHFGLASPCYTHFTSPIRRYPDLQVHRLLRTYFFENNIDQKTINYWDAHLDAIAKQSSDRERNADELERAADDMFMADYMQDHIGEEYDAIVSGVQSFGVFVQLPNRVEGLMKLENMPSDNYIYDENNNTLTGQNSKKIFRIGTHIHVRCIGASKALSQVDFEMLPTPKIEKKR